MNAPATRPGSVPSCDLCAHIGQRGGVQHAGHLVERQHLRLVELVAPVQRHQVLGPDQRGAVGQHEQFGRDVRGRGRRPRDVDLAGPHTREQRCAVGVFARLRHLARADYLRPPESVFDLPDLELVAVAHRRPHVTSAPGVGGRFGDGQRGFVFGRRRVVARSDALGQCGHHLPVHLGRRTCGRVGDEPVQHAAGETGNDSSVSRIQLGQGIR